MVIKRHICAKCLKNYKRSGDGIRARKNIKKNIYVKWGKKNWPEHIYHTEKTRKCIRHHLVAITETAKRRAIKLKASPLWADDIKIKQIYLERINKEFKTGGKYHVDHIIPLQGKNVCGLHIENNLQILPASENIKKSNKFFYSTEKQTYMLAG